ncbi:hypothetical protein EfmAA242_31400 (plasmid) [Enterococcus faecium]|nr:hypothetical protein EfmAA242_31400 [Enterococcus faecium]
MPDVVTMHSSESYKYMSQNALMGLDDVIKENDIDMGNFTEGMLTKKRIQNRRN